MSFAEPADLQHRSEEADPVIAPVPATIFEKRASRLKLLAAGHVIGDYLEAMARLAKTQLGALQFISLRNGARFRPVPSSSARDHDYGQILPEILRFIVLEMELAPIPKESLAALERLKSATPVEVESAARDILVGKYDRIDLAASAFLSAALQVYWTDLASRAKPGVMEKTSLVCPVCGSPPVAGVILSDRKLRYLCCSLCATHWYVPRLTCTNCNSTAGLNYFVIDGDESGTKAEACSQCHTYLKLFYLASNPEADAFSDDLATLPLDLLMSARSYNRRGINLFLLRQ
jgi:FdhE protein